MNFSGLTARALAGVLVFGVLAPMLPATAALSPVISPAPLQSAASAKVAPKNTKAPTISGTTRVPSQLSVTNGTWSGAPTSYTFQWFRCSAAVKKAAATPAATCSTIDSAAAATYTLTDADAGKFIVARVSGVNTSGTVSIHSASTIAITPLVIAPKNVVAPSITGIARISDVVNVSEGSWNENPSSYSYKWLRCPKLVKNSSATRPAKCSDIGGASGPSYQLVPADSKKYVVAVVTATNGAGSTPIFTRSTGLVVLANFAPIASETPSLEGDGAVGGSLSISEGIWAGMPIPSLSFAWYRCPSSETMLVGGLLAGCELLPSSESTYAVVADDVGEYVTAVVTAQNSIGTAHSVARPIGRSSGPPVIVEPQYVAGSRVSGEVLSALGGEFRGFPEPETSHQWYRCTNSVPGPSTSSPSGCVEILSAEGDTYTQSREDLGKYVTVATTKTNALGSITSWVSSSVATLGVPENQVVPAMSGTGAVGSYLTVANGEWTGHPRPTFSYAWFRCPDAPGVMEIGADECVRLASTRSQYQVVSADLGFRIFGTVQAHNSQGSASKVADSVGASGSAPIFAGSLSAGAIGYASLGTRCAILETRKFVCKLQSLQVPRASQSWGDVSAIATPENQRQACVLRGAGEIWCWDNDSPEASKIHPTLSLESITAGYGHFCGIDASGDVWCWGLNHVGQLGDGTTTNRPNQPVQVVLGEPATAVVAGWGHTCALLIDGRVSCWGANGSKQLGAGVDVGASRYTPGFVKENTSAGLVDLVGVQQLSSGWYHACVIQEIPTHAKHVDCWGAGGGGTLGIGSGQLQDRSFAGHDVIGLVGTPNKLALGREHSCALLDDGRVQCWGQNDSGQLELDSSISQSAVAVLMENVEDVAEISASERSTCLLFEDESIQCNGPFVNGSFGHPGNRAPYTHPVGSEFSAFGQEWGLHYPVGSETYQWFRCDEQVSPWSSKYLTSTPSYCEEIVGADSSSYVSTADDAGHYLMTKVTKANTFGATHNYSPTTSLVATPVQFSETPQIIGQATPGNAIGFDDLLTTDGTPAASDLVFRWYRCPTGTPEISFGLPIGCTVVSYSNEYIVGMGDLGSYVFGVVKGSNSVSGYSDSALSEALEVG